MKLLQGKWLAGVLSLAFVAACVGGCSQPAGTPAPAAGSTTGAAELGEPSTGEAASTDTGVDVPEPAAAGSEEKTE